MSSTSEHPHHHVAAGSLLALSLGALGVVFGDIGTSPLYAINIIFFGHSETAINPENVIGAISLVIWALTVVVAVKYITFILRADNDGEGGVFALYALLNKYKKVGMGFIIVLLLLAAGLLFGDGLITPAISVLSAVEGLAVATPWFQPYIIPITLLVLTGLFAIQHKGTSKIGTVFGPVVILWFLAIAALGLSEILKHLQIFNAFNPVYGVQMLWRIGFKHSLLVLGAVMLAITGAEALYADMGHFGKKPIRLSWFAVTYPALLLNYLGQGAFLLGGETILNHNIFYSMVPAPFLITMVILATAATVIASQALISGVFSLSTQAMALGLFPRLNVTHTHESHAGQIYLSFVNWVLYAGCVALVIGFGSSQALATTYGLAVSANMVVTSIAMLAVAHFVWKWHPFRAWSLFGLLALIDLSFLVANSMKFLEGGFIPLSIGLLLFGCFTTWRWGRHVTFQAYTDISTESVRDLVAAKSRATHLLNRSVVIMSPKIIRTENDRIPALMQFFVDRYDVYPKHLIFITAVTEKVPYIYDDRYKVTVFQKEAGKGTISSVVVRFGFMEDPNVESLLEELANHHEIALKEDPADWLVHVSQENLIAGRNAGFFTRLRLKIFTLMRQNSQPAYYFFGLGNEVSLSMEVMPVRIN